MLEMISLIFFGLIVYTFLVIIPTIVERIGAQDFKESYFYHLASKHLNSYGK